MQHPTLSKVPNPLFPSIQDITLYTLSYTSVGPNMVDTGLRGSSLEGQRSIADFFHILDYHIEAVNANDYTLRRLDDDGPPIERSFRGNILPGNYLIEPTVAGGTIMFKSIVTFFNFASERTDSPSKPAAKKAKSDGGWSTDPSDDSQSFKMRLVYRDKGCAVCLAAGIRAIYKYREDSNRYEGAHIVDFAYHELWDTRGFSGLVSDPFTDPANASNPFASPSTRTKKDLGRINSLDNGLLLCLQHHRDYDNFRFAIHPSTHEIFSFHPATTNLQGVEVKAPWDRPDVLYPPPCFAFLELHYFTSISRAMKGSDDWELDDDDENYEEISELEEVQNDQVRIWRDGLSSGKETTTAENKGYRDVG